MCDLVTIGVGLSAISTGVTVYSAYSQAEAMNDAAEYNAQIQERNARLAEEKAVDAEKRGGTDVAKHRRSLRQFKGLQRAGYAGSGAVVDSGSALYNIQETQKFGDEDALTIRENAAKEAKGFRQYGLAYQEEANLSRMSKVSPFLAAGTSLLSGASDLASTYVKYKTYKG